MSEADTLPRAIGGVLPYQYPTTVVLVDDNADFLANFRLELDPRLALRAFDSPVRALEHIHRADRPLPLAERCVSHHRDAVGLSPADQWIRLDVGSLAREVENPDRFAEVSVVVVDYDMPGMDGIEFCRRLRSPHLKRILLTGVGDERVAVNAFNAGVIDQFISKGQRGAAASVCAAIEALQARYFGDGGRLVRESLALEAPGCLSDPAFADYFHRLRGEGDYVEYYFMDEPTGFLLVDNQGRMERLLVYTDADLRAQWEIAHDQEAPEALLRALSGGAHVPNFWRTGGYYRPECREDWEQYLVPAQVLEGEQCYYVARVEPAAGAPVASYADYLAWLDRSQA